MIIETVMFVGGVLATTTVGLPIALAIARPKKWEQTQITPLERSGHDVYYRSYEPMKMDPLPTLWPSEVPRQNAWREEPPWPSELWETPFVSQGGEVVAPKPALEIPSTAEEEAFFQASAKPAKEPANGKQTGQGRSRGVSRTETQPVPRAKPSAKRTSGRTQTRSAPRTNGNDWVSAPPKTAAKTGRGGPPSDQELEKMVTSVGLAATVQRIMDETGWDFRKAAHHLAKARKR